MASTREKRQTAGNKLAKLLEEEEEDDFYKSTYGGFEDEEDDAEFTFKYDYSSTLTFVSFFKQIFP